MDVIRIDGIRASGRHGANPGEREAAQPFDVSAVIELDLRAAERSDNLKDTFDYDVAHTAIVEIVASTSFRLIERLAGEILHTIFSDPRVASAEITVAKPEILKGATPSVTLRRENPNFRAAWPERE